MVTRCTVNPCPAANPVTMPSLADAVAEIVEAGPAGGPPAGWPKGWPPVAAPAPGSSDPAWSAADVALARWATRTGRFAPAVAGPR